MSTRSHNQRKVAPSPKPLVRCHPGSRHDRHARAGLISSHRFSETAASLHLQTGKAVSCSPGLRCSNARKLMQVCSPPCGLQVEPVVRPTRFFVPGVPMCLHVLCCTRACKGRLCAVSFLMRSPTSGLHDMAGDDEGLLHSTPLQHKSFQRCCQTNRSY